MTSAAGEIARPLPKPGVIETLSATTSLMRERPVELLGPYAIVQAIIITEQLIVWGLTLDGGGLPMGLDLLHSLAISLISTFGLAAVIVAAGALAEGRLPGLATTFGPVFQRIAPLLGLFILTFIIAALTIVPGCVTAGVAAAAGADDWLIITLSAVVGLPLVLYVMTRLAVAYQAFILDGAGPGEAMGESWTLTADHKLRLFALILVAVAAVGALQVGIWTLLGLAGEVAPIIGGGLLNIPLTVFGAVAVTLYYLRIRETSPRPEPAIGRGW